jgi:predicted nucleic acid-binding protein
VSSEAIEYELGRIPDDQRRSEMAAILSLAGERAVITHATEKLAGLLEKHGIDPMDAVHLALSSTVGVDYFATCDDYFLRKAKSEKILECKPVSVLALVLEVI